MVRVRGGLWFYEGNDIEKQLERAAAEFLPQRSNVSEPGEARARTQRTDAAPS